MSLQLVDRPNDARTLSLERRSLVSNWCCTSIRTLPPIRLQPHAFKGQPTGLPESLKLGPFDQANNARAYHRD